MSGLSLERLKSFADIVAAGGISAAAGDDSNRQSQFSRQLKELERYFGVELIKRGRGPMKLTPAGEQLHRVISHTFGSLQEFRRHCANRPIELSIGAGESLIQWMLLPRLAQLVAEHPQVTVSFQNLRTDEILKQLADDGLADNTIVFFYGDNGRGLPRAKRWVYDSGMRVPLIIRFPDGRDAGTVRDDLVSFVDFGPTVLSLAGVKVPEHMQGRPFLGDRKAAPRDYVFAARDRMDETYDIIRAVRDKQYKYIRNFECTHAIELAADVAQSPSARDMIHICVGRKHPPAELYDLEADPAEANNLAEDDALRDVRHGLEKRLFDWMRQTGDALLEGPVPSPYYGTSIRELSLG